MILQHASGDGAAFAINHMFTIPRGQGTKGARIQKPWAFRIPKQVKGGVSKGTDLTRVSRWNSAHGFPKFSEIKMPRQGLPCQVRIKAAIPSEQWIP